MLKSLRTYRLLRLAVAATLVMGTMLPLVRYACAMTGMSMTSPAAKVSACAGHDAGMMAEVDARSATSSILCPEEGPCPSAEGCTPLAAGELSCCTEATVQAEKTVILESKLTPAHVILPVIAVLTTADSAPSLYLSPTHELYGDPGGGVSLRVLHASFLL